MDDYPPVVLSWRESIEGRGPGLLTLISMSEPRLLMPERVVLSCVNTIEERGHSERFVTRCHS